MRASLLRAQPPVFVVAFDDEAVLRYTACVMCQAMLDNGSFDPDLCPLLKGLSPEEIAMRMRQQPIASCRKRLDDRVAGLAGDKDDACPALNAEAALAST